MEKSQIDKLMELKQLYESGVLSKEEMEVEKQKILNNGLSNSSKEPTYDERIATHKKNDSANDSFFQKQGVDVIGPLHASIAFDNGGDNGTQWIHHVGFLVPFKKFLSEVNLIIQNGIFL